MKKKILSLLLIAVLLVGTAVPAFADDTDPYAAVVPIADKEGVNAKGYSAHVKWNELNPVSDTNPVPHYLNGYVYDASQTETDASGNTVVKANNYNGMVRFNGISDGKVRATSYTFSFSARREAGHEVMPILFRERETTPAKTVDLVSIKRDGNIHANNMTDGKSFVIGKLSESEWTNITVSVDRVNYRVSYFINGKLVSERTYDASWKLSNNSTCLYINQYGGSNYTTSVKEEDALMIRHGNYSMYKDVVTESDYSYFAHAFPNLIDYTGFHGVSGVLGKALSLRYDLLLDDTQAAAVVRMTRNGKSVTITPTETGKSFAANGKTYKEYTVIYGDIGPQNIADDIVAELMLGENVLAAKTYSFNQYCHELLVQNPDDDKLNTLVHNLLTYGAEAKKYVGTDGNYPMDQVFRVSTDITVSTMGGYETRNGDNNQLEMPFDGRGVFHARTQNSWTKINYLGLFANAEVGHTYQVKIWYRVNNTPNGKFTLNFSMCTDGNGNDSGLVNKTTSSVSNVTVGEWRYFVYNVTYTQEMKDGNITALRSSAGGSGQGKTMGPQEGVRQYYTALNGKTFTKIQELDGKYYVVASNGTLGAEFTDTANMFTVRFLDYSLGDVEMTDLTAAATVEVPASANVHDVNNAGGAQIVSANVIFDSLNKIRFTVEGSDLENVKATLNGKDVILTKVAEGKYIAETDALTPDDYDTVFTLTVGASSVKYSLNSYAYRMRNASIGALVRAAYAYGVAAEAYKNAQ